MVGKLSSYYVKTPGVSFVLPVIWHSVFSFLSRCKEDVSFNLRQSSYTESDLCKDASGPLYVKQLSGVKAVLGCKVATGFKLFVSWLAEMKRVHRQGGAEGVKLRRFRTSRRFMRSSGKREKSLEQSARLLLLRLEWSVRWLLRTSVV